MEKYNIVFYFSDQQRWDTLGCYGQKLNVTPVLDRIAQEGILFENTFTCQPVCGPARSCLQTGKYATENHCHRNAIALPEGMSTIADYFNANGYETAYVGKWHLASNRKYYTSPPDEENFEIRPIPKERMGGYKDFWAASDVLEKTSHGYDGYVYDINGNRMDFIGYRADAINNYAIHYLHQKKSENPFFLFISQIEPHHQDDTKKYEGPDGSKARFADFTPPGDLHPGEGDWEDSYPDYLGQCHSLDENVGRLIDTLKEEGLWDHTILFYTSDHGSHFKTRNSEYKRSCHEASIHVPLIAVGGPFQGGRRIDNLVSLIDLPATLLDCAGIPIPDDFQGRSLKKLVEGDSPDWENCVFLQVSETELGRSIRTPRWKYYIKAEENGWDYAEAETYYETYLFDLKQDPYEQNNLISDPDYEKIRHELAEKISECMIKAHEKKPVILSRSLNKRETS